MKARNVFIIATCALAGLSAASLVQLRPWSSDGPAAHPCLRLGVASERVACWSDELVETARADGVPAALDETVRLTRRYDQFRADCHSALHPLGEYAGRRAGVDDMPIAGAEERPACRQGYLHGFFIGRTESGTLDVATEGPSCARRPLDEIGDCAHALGHAYLRETAGDVDAALESCAPFARRRSQHDQCGWGVYMETAFRSQVGAPVEIDCRTVADTWEALCWEFEPSRLSWSGTRWDDIAEACNELEGEAARQCAGGLGSAAPRARSCDGLEADLRPLCRSSRPRE